MSPTAPPTRAPQPWQLYEQQVEKLLAGLNDGRVGRNVKRPGILSGQARQIDVLAEGTLVGEPVSIVVECKRYKKKRIGIDLVESFVGKLLDLGVGRGIMYSYAGFTKDAYLRAVGALNPRVTLEDWSGLAVGLVPLGSPEPYVCQPSTNTPSTDLQHTSGGEAAHHSGPERLWEYQIPHGYEPDEYRHFLLTGSFPGFPRSMSPFR
jgi:hypothetical protein